MNSVVIYASTSGNTRTVAEAILVALEARGPARLVPVSEATSTPDADLVVLGAPTEGHTVSKAMAGWMGSLASMAFSGRRVAVFDTRLGWPRFLSGSAADEMARRVEALGGELVAPPQSFIVSMKPALEPGELERATAWAADLADALVATAA